MKKANIFKLIGIIAIVAIIGFLMAGCPIKEDTDPDPDPSDEWKSGDVWLKTKESKYKIVEDEEEEVFVAGNINSEIITEWSIYRYASNKKFEQKYKEILPAGYMEYYTNRDGLIEEKSGIGVIKVSDTDYPVNSKVKNEYDEDTGLMIAKETSINADGEEEEPKVHTITLIDNSGGIKTYTNTGGFGDREYKIKDGEIIEQKVKLTSASYTIKYTLPTNEVIRAKLPDFRLDTMTGDGGVYSDSYQEVSVVSNTDSALVIRVKTFSKSNWSGSSKFELDEQSDFTYTKFTYPFNETEE
jgi:hypothetical protein